MQEHLYSISYQQKNQIALAVRDMNILRGRAGLTAVSENINPDSCRRLLRKERRIELLAEWGNRWMDLKRWNIADSILRPMKGAAWAPTDVRYPIPQLQIELNRNLVQNPGY